MAGPIVDFMGLRRYVYDGSVLCEKEVGDQEKWNEFKWKRGLSQKGDEGD